MSQDNHITLRGYLTAEPKLYQKTQTATPVTEIRVGSTPRRLNRETGEWYDAPASYFTVKCWRRLAINAASSLHKGDTVVVRGRVYMNQWVDAQQRRQSRMEIEADSLGHDLAYGWSRFLRGTRSQGERADEVNAGEAARQDIDSANPALGDDDYSTDGDLGESGQGEGAFPPEEQRAMPTPITDGDEGGDLGRGDVLAGSPPAGADDVSDGDREVVAVPF
ncbi:MAG: single-stranded DNA-binding protein [Trebonia sp.]